MCTRYVHRNTLTDIHVALQTEPIPGQILAGMEIMSNYRNQRRLNALLGVFLTVVAAVPAALLGGHLLATPVLAMQVSMTGLAGACLLVGATDSFGGWEWYRWSGFGQILLGLSLPLGFIGMAWDLFFIVVTGLGALLIAAMGIDLFAFHGKYTRQTPLNQHNQ